MYSSEQIFLILGTSFIFTFKTQSKYDLADESLGVNPDRREIEVERDEEKENGRTSSHNWGRGR